MSRTIRRAASASLGMLVPVLMLGACSGGAMAADRAVSPGGSDSNPCTLDRPCQSFQRGYESASPGMVVEVGAGAYGSQTLNTTPKAGGPAVVFRPAAGAAVTVRSLDVTRASYVEFQGMQVLDETYNRQGAQYVTYRGMRMTAFFIRGADHISYINSEVGPNSAGNEVMNWISAAYETTDAATDILFDGVAIHDFRKYSDDAHIDCIGIDDVDGIVIRNTRIWNCEHFGIIFGNDFNNRATRNAVLENNFIDCCFSGYYSVGLGGLDGPITMRFNSMTEGVGWLNGTDLVPNGLVSLDSNIIASNASSNCSRGTWRFNIVASGSACGGGGKTAPTGFVGPPSDLHLKPGSAAVGAGNPSSHPAGDIDGQARLQGRPEAGADQINVPASAPSAPGGTPPPPSRVPDAGIITRRPSQWKRERGAPRATLRVRRPTLAQFLARGMTMRVRCSEACRVRAQVQVSKKIARRYRIPRTLDKATARSKRHRVTLRVKPSRRVARRLGGANSLFVSLQVRAADKGGRAARTRVPVRLAG